MVRSVPYIRSGQSDHSPTHSLFSLIRPWSRVWIILWFGLDSLNRALYRICTLSSETFPESGKSDQNQELQTKKQPVSRKKKINTMDCFLKSTSQFYLMNIEVHAKDEV